MFATARELFKRKQVAKVVCLLIIAVSEIKMRVVQTNGFSLVSQAAVVAQSRGLLSDCYPNSEEQGVLQCQLKARVLVILFFAVIPVPRPSLTITTRNVLCSTMPGNFPCLFPIVSTPDLCTQFCTPCMHGL